MNGLGPPRFEAPLAPGAWLAQNPVRSKPKVRFNSVSDMLLDNGNKLYRRGGALVGSPTAPAPKPVNVKASAPWRGEKLERRCKTVLNNVTQELNRIDADLMKQQKRVIQATPDPQLLEAALTRLETASGHQKQTGAQAVLNARRAAIDAELSRKIQRLQYNREYESRAMQVCVDHLNASGTVMVANPFVALVSDEANSVH